MVLAALYEQLFPSARGLTRDQESILAGNDVLVWQRQNITESRQTQQQYILTDDSISRQSSKQTKIEQHQEYQQQSDQYDTAAAATRQKRKRCRATKCLASFAADFDVITDWVFYIHCCGLDRSYRSDYEEGQNKYSTPYLIPPVLLNLILISCILGTMMWLILATDGAIASPLLRRLGYDKLCMGHVLFACVLVEDVPQVVLTFLVEDYFEEGGEFNNYALINVIASLYDTLIKLAEAFDERTDVVETGCWCKESITAHKKEVTCIVPIPEDDDDDDDYDDEDVHIEVDAISASPSFAMAAESAAQFKKNVESFVSRMHISSTTLSPIKQKSKRKSLLKEAKEIVSETKLPPVQFLSASKDDKIRLWDTSANIIGRTGHGCSQTYRGHQGGVSCMVFVGKFRRNMGLKTDLFFLSGGYDGTTKLWNTATPNCVQTYNTTINHNDEQIEVTSIALLGINETPLKKDFFVNGYSSGKARLWDIWSGECLVVFEGHSSSFGTIHSICSMNDSRHFVTASMDGTIKMWDGYNMTKESTIEEGDSSSTLYQTKKISEKTFIGHAGAVLSVECVSPGLVILSGSEDRTARLWSVESGACLRIFVGHSKAVTTVAVVDQVTFLTGSKDTTIKVWDAMSASCIRTYKGHTGAVTSVSTTSQSGTFISASEDLTVKLWVFSAILPNLNNKNGEEDGGTLNEILGVDNDAPLSFITCQDQ
jgi:WD40 repeat protein